MEKRSKKRELVIFDFDGTIVDSKAAYYSSLIKHLGPLGFSKKQIDNMVGMGLSLIGTLRKLGFNWFYRLYIKKKIIKDVKEEVNKVKKCRDVSHITDVKSTRILVSNSTSDFIVPVLKHLKLKKYFKEIYGSESFEYKEDFIKKYLRKNKIKKNQCYYIGDRVKDTEVAKKVGCKSMIISNKCSWDSRKEILASKPDYIVSDLEDVAEIVNS